MEAGLSPQSHLKTFPALLSIWNHVSFPFIAISALPDLDDCPMLVLPEIPNISGVIHLSLDSSGAGLGGGDPKTQIPKDGGISNPAGATNRAKLYSMAVPSGTGVTGQRAMGSNWKRGNLG